MRIGTEEHFCALENGKLRKNAATLDKRAFKSCRAKVRRKEAFFGSPVPCGEGIQIDAPVSYFRISGFNQLKKSL